MWSSQVADTQQGHLLMWLDHVNVALNGHRVLHDITWALKRGENWAFFGHNGAGKSTLLRLVRGEIWPDPVNGGTRIYGFGGTPTASPIGMKRRMAVVSAEQQQRYIRVHGRKYGDDFSPFITVRDIVFTGLLDGDLVTRKPKPAEIARINRVLREVGIGDLADVQFDQLSQGQLRKALIARAIIGAPDVLILDEVGVGLDTHARHAVLEMIQRVAERGTQILMTTHRRDELIPAISHVLELKGGRITRAEALSQNPFQSEAKARVQWKATTSCPAPIERPYLINITHANVALGEGKKVVLHDVTWRMNEGEHWMILGDNGVGKTTLLKLILGDLRPAHGGSIGRFNQPDFRNVWEIKKRIGYVSADLQTRYAVDLTTEQVIASGFFASIGWLQPLNRTQQRRVHEMIGLFGLQDLAKRSILEMSYGQARKVLVARALVGAPKLLILDEVFDGLDAQFRAELTGILENLVAPLPPGGVGSGGGPVPSIILVSHHEADTLPCITHRMVLEKGRIVRQEVRSPLPMGEVGGGPA
jgi:molybdate transport system ATP-binding protein